MKFQTISQGHICKRPLSAQRPVGMAPRLAQANDGSLVCVYVIHSKLAVNDFLPMLSRSLDGGETWRDEGPIFPAAMTEQWSINMPLSRDVTGNLYLFGSRYKIDVPGETNWCDETQGIKSNELVWSISRDHGKNWSEPKMIPMPIPGSAEAPAPMTVTRSGRWIGPYSPYHTFDPNLRVDRGQVVVVFSDDRGETWNHTSMLRFDEPNSGGAEAWCIELSDGRLLGTAWHIDYTRGDGAKEYTNKFALSRDGGSTWSKTRSTEILGHTTALTALPDGRALFIYASRRNQTEAGIWAAVVEPTEDAFNVLHHERVWRPDPEIVANCATESAQWTAFRFGEPAAVLLSDGTILFCYWYLGKDDSGVGSVKIKLVE